MWLRLGRNVRVGVDFDSTVARIDVPWLARLNSVRGTSYRPEDWTDWNLSFRREADREVFVSLLTPDLYDTVEPYPGAADAIRRLGLETPIELVCVTRIQTRQRSVHGRNAMAAKAHPATADAVIPQETGLGLTPHRRRTASLPDRRLRHCARKQALNESGCAIPIQYLV